VREASVPVNPADDLTPDVAEGYDDLRDEISPGARLFALRHADQGFEPIPIGGDTTGEVPSGWRPPIPAEPNVFRVAELGDVTDEVLLGVDGFAFVPEGETVVRVLAVVGDPVRPTLLVARDWAFRTTLADEADDFTIP
jgi:hypothetical protein